MMISTQIYQLISFTVLYEARDIIIIITYEQVIWIKALSFDKTQSDIILACPQIQLLLYLKWLVVKLRHYWNLYFADRN
jgi:hypothetical protein